MGTNGWRRLNVMSAAKLHLRGDSIIVQQDHETAAIPLSQLHTILIANQAVSLSTALINRLSEEKISLIICNQKYNPAVQLSSFHNGANDNLTDQITWEQSRKDRVWIQILKHKLQTEANLLAYYDLPSSAQILKCKSKITAIENCDFAESQAARWYFHDLFGPQFCRRTDNHINAALNYGYSIILSAFSRQLTIHGYHPAVGIHHVNQKNPYNLSCDLMEPFRSIVDEFVFCNPDRELDWDYRKELIGLTKKNVIYNDRKMEMDRAIDSFVLDVLAAMKHPHYELGALENAR